MPSTSSVSKTPFRIAIVGAGPAGLTLAAILCRKAQVIRDAGGLAPWTVDLYEAEPSLEARRVGGSLDLGKNTGLAAIEAAGVMSRFSDFSRPEGQEMRVMTPSGDLLVHNKGDVGESSAAYSPEIDRADLNRVLCEAVPPEWIHWGHKLKETRSVINTNEHVLVFADGSSVVADLVVGADGAWSRVRSLLTPEQPEYSGTVFLDCTLRDFDSRFPDHVDLVGYGSLYSFGGGKVLIAQRNGYGVLRLYLGFQAPKDWATTSPIMETSSDQERAHMLIETLYSGWDERLQRLILAAGTPVNNSAESTMVPRALFALPVGIQLPHRTGVTVIGDAAHLMSPCAGEGVNMAMLDAMRLAEALASAADAVEFSAATDVAVAAYEREMFKRVAGGAQRSADNLDIFVGCEMTHEVISRLSPRTRDRYNGGGF